MAFIAIVAFAFGLCFDNLVTKSYADGRATESFAPAESTSSSVREAISRF